MKNWKLVFFSCAFMLVFGIVFQSIPPIVGFLREALGITNAQAGALMSLFGLPGIFISIPGGILSDLYGAKIVGTISLALTFIGSLFVAFGANYATLLTGRVISGVGALTISVVAAQILAQRVDKADLGKVMGIFNTVVPLGTIITLNTFGRLAQRTTWRIPLLLAAGYSLIMLFLYYFRYPSQSDPEDPGEKPSLKDSILYLKQVKVAVWLLGLIWLFYNAGAIAYISFVGDYYVSVGHELSYAGFLASLIMIMPLFLSPVVGVLIDRFGKDEYFIIFGAMAMTILFWLVPKTSLNPVFIGVLIGISAACVPPPIFALLPRFLSPARMGLGYGILASLLNIGVLIGPFLVGYFSDLTANYLLGFKLMSVLILLTTLTAILFKCYTKE